MSMLCWLATIPSSASPQADLRPRQKVCPGSRGPASNDRGPRKRREREEEEILETSRAVSVQQVPRPRGAKRWEKRGEEKGSGEADGCTTAARARRALGAAGHPEASMCRSAAGPPARRETLLEHETHEARPPPWPPRATQPSPNTTKQNQWEQPHETETGTEKHQKGGRPKL